MRITFAADYKDESGKSHKADSTADLPYSEASNLLWAGLARTPDNDDAAKSAGTTKEAK